MEQKLYTVLYGSKLYGTSTPTSDRDVKHIVLPDLRNLLIGKQVKNVVKKTNTEKHTRNGADDVDTEFIPVQIFARDFMAGQTYALELAFSLPLVRRVHETQLFDVLNEHVYYALDESKPLWAEQEFDSGNKLNFLQFVGELREHFLTSNIKAMMGYVVNQASLYSFKGERLNVARELQTLLTFADDYYKEDEMKLSEYYNAPIWKERTDALAAKYPKYFKVTEYDIGDGRMMPCFTLLEKVLPHTNTLIHTMTVVNKVVEKYGTRADQASASNVDWKATMHALRIVDEGLQLLEQHSLTLPLQQAKVDRLLSIKRGEVSIDEVRSELDEKLNRLKNLEQTTSLSPSSSEMTAKFEIWLANWMIVFYGLPLKSKLLTLHS